MKKLLSILLCIAVAMGCMPTMVFAGIGELPKPDVLLVKMGTSANALTTLQTKGDDPAQEGSSQTYRLSANPKISLGEDNEYLYLQVERIAAYKEATKNEMTISYQIGNHVFAIEPTKIDGNTVRIPLSQLCIQVHDEYDSINIEVKSGEVNYYYRGHLTDIFSGTSNPHNIFGLGKYVGYYTSDDNHAISIFEGVDGKIKGRVVDEVDDRNAPLIKNLSVDLLQDVNAAIKSETLSVSGFSDTAKLEVKDGRLHMIKKYSYRRAGERQKEEIAADTVFIKSTASVVNNVNTNKSYPSLEQAMAEARSGDNIRILENMTITRSINVDTDVTLDLNGKKVTAGGNLVQPFYMSEQGKLTVKNSSNSGGIMVNVNPTNAQKALNYAVDYTTLNFAPGDYGKLEIRNRSTDKIEDSENMKGRYERTLKHITFIGQEGTILEQFLVQPGHHYSSDGTGREMVDYATGENIKVNEANGYFSILNIDHMTFQNLEFKSTKNEPAIYFAYWYNGQEAAQFGPVDHLTINECKFNLENSGNSSQAINLSEGGTHTFHNVSIKDNVVEKAYQGIYLGGACGGPADIEIKGNVIKNTVHNAIALQGEVRGKAVITENIIDGAKDRAFRFNDVFSSADIKINNNIILNSGDGEGKLIKDHFIEAGAKIDLEHNYWQLTDGKTLDQAVEGNLQTPTTTGIISGTFPQNVSQYVGEGYECVSDGTGRYVVREIYRPIIVPPAKPDVTTDSTTEGTTTKTEAQATTSGKETTATISDQAAKKLVEQAAAKDADEVAVEVPKGNKPVIKVELPAETINGIVENTDAALTIITSNGDVSFDNKALEAISKGATGDKITIVAEVVEQPSNAQKKIVGDDGVLLDLKVIHANGFVTAFGEGKVTIAIPIPDRLLNKTVKVVYLADDGAYVTLSGSEVVKDGKQYYVFETGHFSSYALVDGKTADRYFAKIRLGVKNTKINASTTAKKGSITVKWKKSAGFKVDYYQVFRSTKKNIGYGTKAFYTTKTGTQKSYKNTKQLKKGTRYYYKVRGVRVLDGQKVYTKWSNKAIRIAK